MTATTSAASPADLVDGLKRLKLAKVRAIAPDVIQTAQSQSGSSFFPPGGAWQL
jgi:hypothetical protein